MRQGWNGLFEPAGEVRRVASSDSPMALRLAGQPPQQVDGYLVISC
jgi:hypothetical protein